MSGNYYMYSAEAASDATDLLGSNECNVFEHVALQCDVQRAMQVKARGSTQSHGMPKIPLKAPTAIGKAVPYPSEADPTGYFPVKEENHLFKTVRANIVQSIRAFRVVDLADEAKRLEQHFLYANCAHVQTKGEVLETITTSFLFSRQPSKNFDALSNCLTNILADAGMQPGFVVVLEGLPAVAKFDKEARETLLDVFREAAEFWAERKVPFRVFYSFA